MIATQQDYQFDPKKESVDQYNARVAKSYTPASDTQTRQPRDTEQPSALSELSSLRKQVETDTQALSQSRQSEREAAANTLNSQLLLIDQSVADKIRGIDTQEKKDLSRVGALNVRSGLMGSSFGASNNQQVEIATEKERQAARDYGTAKKGALYDANVVALNEIENRFQQRQQSLRQEKLGLVEKQISLTEADKKKAEENLKTIAQSGTIGFEEFKGSGLRDELIEQTGQDPLIIDSMFRQNSRDAVKYTVEKFLPGKDGSTTYYRAGIDASGKPVEENYELSIPYAQVSDTNYKFTMTSDGTALFVPDKIDPTQPLDKQIKVYGAQGQFSKSSGDTISSDPYVVGKEKGFSKDDVDNSIKEHGYEATMNYFRLLYSSPE